MKVFILFEVQWTDRNGEDRRVIDVYARREEAERVRSQMDDDFSYSDVDHGQDYEIEEREIIA